MTNKLKPVLDDENPLKVVLDALEDMLEDCEETGVDIDNNGQPDIVMRCANQSEQLINNLKALMKTHVLVEVEQPSMSLKKAKEAHDALLGWQPIETAPKDGRKMLIATKLYAGGVVQAHYCEHAREFIDDDLDSYGDATHWMPLPSAPSKGGDDAA